MSAGQAKAAVGEPDSVRPVSDLPSEDSCRRANGDQVFLYQLKDSPLQFWKSAAERTVRLCIDSAGNVIAKEIQVTTR
jgi:hypothetical protein